jgi:ribose transport system ATP-binding protein
MTFDGVSGFPPAIADAMSAGLALVPEDRVQEGIFADMSVRHNLSSAVVGDYWRRFRLRHSYEHDDAMRIIEAFDVRPASDLPMIGALSGGNQQKVVLARWLRREPRLLLLDEPTQGVDVGARASIHHHVRSATAKGAGALYVSSDFEELAMVCDRVVVLSEGRIKHNIVAPDITGEAITSLCYAASEVAA